MTKLISMAVAAAVGLSAAASAQTGKSGKAPVRGAPTINLSGLSECPAQGQAVSVETLCLCSGGANGSVWGSGPYTGDSNLCTAALHAGAVGPSGGAVRVIPGQGQSSYAGSTANSVTSRSWGSYGTSFDVLAATGGAAVAATDAGLPACTKMPDGVDLLACACPANPTLGSVWGNGPYTHDSDICTAAIHNGYIGRDEGGEVYVLRVPGLPSYASGENAGIVTSDWGSYGSSIIFDWNR
ncbi:MAG: LCCL domain-containing protein [Rhodobacter sp.]|nr:LCCL domain-containing protein [Rhodobacter sp.]